ncbi:ATP-binding protein [Streptomyces sp. NPDC059917]|uniref:ATP-binding protein n=1 Tax=Streptomyces sp. NPDC059917 TaxID=3347002 RepID=UPI003668D149
MQCRRFFEGSGIVKRRESDTHSFTFCVPATKRAVRRGRRRVVDIARIEGYPLDVESMSCLALLTGEVIANAVLHTADACVVTIAWNGRRVRVEVTDTQPVDEIPEGAGTDGENGRGLLILNSLAAAWGRRAAAPGKVTWFEIDPDLAGFRSDAAGFPGGTP